MSKVKSLQGKKEMIYSTESEETLKYLQEQKLTTSDILGSGQRCTEDSVTILTSVISQSLGLILKMD